MCSKKRVSYWEEVLISEVYNNAEPSQTLNNITYICLSEEGLMDFLGPYLEYDQSAAVVVVVVQYRSHEVCINHMWQLWNALVDQWLQSTPHNRSVISSHVSRLPFQ